MRKSLISSAVLLAVASSGANAALTNDGTTTLSINDGVPTCLIGGTYPTCDYGAFSVAAGGSYFTMNGNNAAVVGDDLGATGIVLGTAQAYSGSAISAGNPYPGDGTNIVDAWPFFNNTGTNFSVGAGVSAVSDTEIDFSGWRVAWAEVASIDMGQGANATMLCSGGDGCQDGDTYVLDYAAVVPAGDPSGFGGVPYALHLEGTVSISAVPVPAAVWLFGSGLLGLVGVARRKKA